MSRVAKLLLTFLVTALVLWLPFSVACLAGVVVSAGVVLAWFAVDLAGRWPGRAAALKAYAKNLLGGMDRVLSSLRGLDARYTFSAHCGAAAVMGKGAPLDLLVMCLLLDLISAGHCEGAAKREGLIT